MNFVAIDVETANADMSSICQIGLVICENGSLVHEWKTYVDPEDFFDGINISVHGISEVDVEGAPTFAELTQGLHEYLENAVVVCHTHFDRVSIHQAAEKYAVPLPDCTWLDTARVARRAWEQCARSGYGLYNLCKIIGHQFSHHDALEDAKAAAHILLAAIEKTGLDVDGWLKRVERPVRVAAWTATGRSSVIRQGNPEGPLSGEVVVFTGAIGIPRQLAADLAADLGCEVAAGVTKKTTMLVVGDQDTKRLAGHAKSAKHRKAELLIQQGISIRILRESDFKKLAKLEGAPGATALSEVSRNLNN